MTIDSTKPPSRSGDTLCLGVAPDRDGCVEIPGRSWLCPRRNRQAADQCPAQAQRSHVDLKSGLSGDQPLGDPVPGDGASYSVTMLGSGTAVTPLDEEPLDPAGVERRMPAAEVLPHDDFGGLAEIEGDLHALQDGRVADDVAVGAHLLTVTHCGSGRAIHRWIGLPMSPGGAIHLAAALRCGPTVRPSLYYLRKWGGLSARASP